MPIIRAERRRLRDWLATNIPIQWGRRVTRIEENNSEVSVHFTDGSSAKGDIVVGADGINSVGVLPLTAFSRFIPFTYITFDPEKAHGDKFFWGKLSNSSTRAPSPPAQRRTP